MRRVDIASPTAVQSFVEDDSMKIMKVSPIPPVPRRTINDYAQDATVGAGNFDERPSPAHRVELERRLGHPPDHVEWNEFLRAWGIFHQMLEQP